MHDVAMMTLAVMEATLVKLMELRGKDIRVSLQTDGAANYTGALFHVYLLPLRHSFAHFLMISLALASNIAVLQRLRGLLGCAVMFLTASRPVSITTLLVNDVTLDLAALMGFIIHRTYV